MSKEDIKRFTKDVKNDAKLREDLKKAGGQAAAIVKFAADKGYKFTAGELKKYVESKKGELSEEQLAKVAGGSAVAVVTVVVEVL